jgi:hypothetical protein
VSAFGGQIARGSSYPHALLSMTPADHRPALEIRLREWFELAGESGAAGWSGFDMLLIEEGVGSARRCSDLPYTTRELMRAPEVARALSSLPPEIRATGEWWRRVTGQVELAPAAAGGRSSGWEQLPEITRWVIEEPLSSGLLETALGELWVERLKEEMSGAAQDREQALAAAAAVIFDQRLQAAAQPRPGS